MVESEKPEPRSELSSDTVIEVTRLGTFIKLNRNDQNGRPHGQSYYLYIQILGMLSGPRFALL